MSSPRSTGPRTERPDTKTLVRLGQGGLVSVEPADEKRASEAEPAAERGSETRARGKRTPVQLWFKGLHEPVRARAELGESGLQLTALLPFLELDSIVGFTTAEGGALLHGRIRRVRLEASASDPVPQLSIELGLGEGLATAIPAAIDAPQAAAPARVSVPPPVAAGLEPRRTGSRYRLLSWLAALAIGAAAGAGAVYAFLSVRGPAPEPEAAAPTLRLPAPARVAAPSIVETLAAERAAELALASAAQLEASRDMLFAYSVQAPAAFEDESEPSDDAANEAADTSAALDVLFEPEAQPVPAGGDPALLPQVTVHGMQTRVFIPMRGEGQGLQQYELTTPGMAVTVPRAGALIPLGNYAIVRGLVRRVWLRKHGDGVQVRVITRRPATRSSVSFDGAGLSISLEP